MITQFLGQGFKVDDSNSVGYHLLQCLQKPDVTSFTCITAFISESALFGLEQVLSEKKNSIKEIIIITGIDQKGTSKEALQRLLEFKTAKSFVFYNRASAIFHPKLYLLIGQENTYVIIGSANFTGQGLFTNIENCVLFTLNNEIKEDMEFLEQIKNYYEELLNLTDPNLRQITQDLINQLVEWGIVPTQAEVKNNYKKITGGQPKTNAVRELFPLRATAKAPKNFRVPKEKVSSEESTSQPAVTSNSQSILATNDPVWISGPLSERDLNIPSGSNTNRTGSMFIKKGRMRNIDQRHYFRDVVFSGLNWNFDTQLRTAHYERAKAQFHIVINGEDKGVYELQLNHNTDTESATYAQNNSMTSLSWGNALEFIAKRELIGETAYLYNTGNNQFLLEIR